MIWFKRKPKNRRLGREYVLDVKLRSSQVRAARARMAAVALVVVFGSVLGVCLLWRGGEWVLNKLVYENKAFAIERLEVQTDGVISAEQLRRWTGVRLGENLLGLDLARVQRDLKMVSLIQSVSVERIPPHTLCVRVVEREPIAQVGALRPSASGGIDRVPFLLDAEGYVIVPLDPRQRSSPANTAAEPLPLILGVNQNEIQAGRKIEQAQVRTALELLAAFEHSSMQSVVEIKSVDVSAPQVLLVSTAQGSQVTFGLRDLEQQLRRWRAVFDLAQKYNKTIATLDLAVTSSLPVTFLEASAAPPAAQKPAKQSKRKHV